MPPEEEFGCFAHYTPKLLQTHPARHNRNELFMAQHIAFHTKELITQISCCNYFMLLVSEHMNKFTRLFHLYNFFHHPHIYPHSFIELLII